VGGWKNFMYIGHSNAPHNADLIDAIATKWRIRTSLVFSDFREFFIVYGRKLMDFESFKRIADPTLTRLDILKFVVELIRESGIKRLVVIGGSALVLHNIKPATEYVDLFVWSEDDYELLKRVLERKGFLEFYHGDVLRRFGNMFTIDVFVGDLIEFIFSDSMRRRCKKIHYQSIVFEVMSPTDVILLKSAILLKDRVFKDISDIKRVIMAGVVKWDALIKELSYQKKITSHSPNWLSRIKISLERAGAPNWVLRQIEKLDP